MLAFLEFAAIIVVGIVVLFGVLVWVKQDHPRWRNFAAFAVATGAAYSASFALDIFIGAVLKVYSFSPFTLPVFTWSGMAIVLHRSALFVETRRWWTATPYLGLGTIAVAVGLVGPHRYSIAVGVPLVLFAVISLAQKRSTGDRL